jgi:alginate O-acetyltransferase complex protein AlgI
MSFVSIEFAFLLTVVLALLAFIRIPVARKIIVLLASCIFYAWWDWRFLGLLATVTLLDYYVSMFLVSATSPKKRMLLVWLSILVNLGFLGFFKYYNFFVESLDVLTLAWGWRIGTLNIILPIGISFYTFETLSYVIDVYRGIARPAKSLLDYAIFISFFPRLVAGPIMRASQFLPQLDKGIQLNWTNLVEGSQYFLRGMLKKMVIADNVAVMVDQIYKSPSLFSSSSVWLAVLAYSVQILYDFWGYTDMARGIGKMLGIELPKNFDLPYSAQSITEFWNRWHISLSTWLRDYLYIPLGGNRKGKFRTYLNLMLTMLLGGLWHGASWNFVLWGGLHGLYLSIERLLLGSKPEQKPWTSIAAWGRAGLVFLLVTVTWVPFRSPNWQTTLLIFKKLLFIGMQYNIEWYYIWAVIAVPLVVIGGWLARRFEWRWPVFTIQHSYTPAFMLFELLIVFFFSPLNASPFIYFQF